MTKIKVITIVGTRPEIIRLSRLIPALDVHTDHIFVHTGQNYDRMLNDIFFEELGLRLPDYFLNTNTNGLGAMMGDILSKIEPVFISEKPDAVVILGDTNSSICALLARRMHIPVYHLEAGNRSFDQNVPEETNRKMVDHVSDFNLPYNTWSFDNLINEGVHPRRMIKSGSPMGEIFEHYLPQISAKNTLESLKLSPKGYFLVSAHRQENVDSPVRLANLLDTLKALTAEWKMPVLVSTHPRTRKKLELFSGYDEIEGLTFHEPFGFFDYINLQINAKVVLSDSGTISEESSILGFPAVTLRDSIERPEALETGSIMMAGLREKDVLAAVHALLDQHSTSSQLPEGYEVRNFSQRVTNFILSTASRHHDWAGIRKIEQ